MSVQQNITNFRQTLRDRASELGGVAEPVRATQEILPTSSSSTDVEILNNIVSSFTASPEFTGTASFQNIAITNSLIANNSAGNNGQVLESNGSSIYWNDRPPTNFANGQSITVNVVTANSITSSNVSFTNASLLGTPTAPTANSGTNTTQLATTAFVTSALRAAYPVGSIYLSTVSTNPSTLLGFGTWVAFGTGKMLISADGTYAAGSTGGSATTTLAVENLPSHTHTFSGTTSATNLSHTHTYGGGNVADAGGDVNQSHRSGSSYTTSGASVDMNHTHTFSGTTSGTGSGSAVTTISPYIAVYMWNRTV